MFRILGMDEYQSDKRFDTIAHLIGHIEAFTSIVNERFLRKTRPEWAAIFTSEGVVFENLLHYTDVVKDTQAMDNHYLEEVRYGSGGVMIQPRFPVSFSEYDVKPTMPASGIGGDTESILKDYGYTKSQIDNMAARNIIGINNNYGGLS